MKRRHLRHRRSLADSSSSLSNSYRIALFFGPSLSFLTLRFLCDLLNPSHFSLSSLKPGARVHTPCCRCCTIITVPGDATGAPSSKTYEGIRVVTDHGDEFIADVVLFATGLWIDNVHEM
ncbi:Glutathione reductase [Carex littledalei]|uniref:Glutathione reductase n=1 Tax=Carex littledalei TaxID=544730 RepID=A0A833R4Z7_9POAL|nr:Glutathione reductase [Carex littledalei]